MILVARIGGPSGIEMVCDTDENECIPTPEWCEDMVHRLARQALETYEALPDSKVGRGCRRARRVIEQPDDPPCHDTDCTHPTHCDRCAEHHVVARMHEDNDG